MLTSVNTVIERRTTFTASGGTVPFEAGWAAEAVFFVQVEAGHPPLVVTPEASPDGMAWTPWGESREIGPDETLAGIRVAHYGNWLRLNITGPSTDAPATLLVHLALKG